MRIAVVGATGRTGAKVVELLLAEGHSVRALTRSPSWEEGTTPPPAANGMLQWVEGDALDPSSIARLASGADAFVVALGPTADSPPDLCSRGTTAVISACRAFRIKRLVVVTGAMIGHPRELLAVVLRSISGMYGLFRSSSLADRRKQEELVMASGLDWTLVRPPRLVDGDRTGQLLAGSELFVHATAYATVGDVARVIVDALADGRWVKGGVVVVSGVAPEATAPAPVDADLAAESESASEPAPDSEPAHEHEPEPDAAPEAEPAPIATVTDVPAAPPAPARALPTHEDLPPLTQTPVTASEAVPAPAPTPTPAPQQSPTTMSATVEWEDDEDWFDPDPDAASRAASRDPWPQRDQMAHDQEPALVSDPGAGGRDGDDPDR